MTIINNIEINVSYNYKNKIRDAILNNDPIEEKLNVIIVLSNPCLFAKRYILMKQFINRIETYEENVNLYIVELIYENQKYTMTDKNNKNHLQLYTKIPLWHKENMINLGVKYLLPSNYKAFAWIDADIEFENNNWVIETLKILNGCKDIVQLFSHCDDMDTNNNSIQIVSSAGYHNCHNKKYCSKGVNYWHPGYAWAITRKGYEKIGGVYENGILGSGDYIMLLCLLNNGINSINSESNEDYKNSILKYEKNMKTLRFGYVPGLIRHHFHGSKKNRRYNDRWKILVKYNYSPDLDITTDEKGVLIPTSNFNQDFIKEIYDYFLERNDDEL